MKTILIISITLTFDIAFSQEIKGLKVERSSVDATTMYECGCFCSMESYEDPNEFDYYLTFDQDNYGILTSKHMEKVFNKLVEVLNANGREIKDPDMISVTDYATHPVLKEILLKLKTTCLSEERFDYVIGDYVVALIYSSKQYQLFIYKNPYAGMY